MTDTKISLSLSAANNISRPVDAASKSFGRLKGEVGDTGAELRELGKKQQLVTRFKSLSGQVDVTRKKLAGAKEEVKQLQQSEISAAAAVKGHASALKAAERAVLQTAGAYGVGSEQVKVARQEVSKLSKVKKESERALKKERAALKGVHLSSKRLTAAYGRQSKELGGLRRDMGAAGLKLNALGAEELRLAKRTKQANAALERQATSLKKVQTIQGRIDARNAQKGELVGQAFRVAVQAAPLIMAGKRAIEYESTFADVKKVVDFSSEKEEAQYRSKMMRLAGDLGVKQKGIADIVTAAGQSGIEKSQLLQFAESATKMSVAWDVSAEEAGSTLATWRAAMGLTQKNALDLADATNYLSNNMNAKAKDIAAVMVRQGSTAMGAGMSANETAALASSLIAGGATSEIASTALKNISGALTAGYAATGSQKEALGRIGFDADELASSMQHDAQGTLLGVLRELQDVSADERGAVISQLFGTEIKGAVSKLVTTLDDDKNGLIAAFGRVAKEADRAGSVEQEYANRAKTRGHTLSQLGSKFDRLMITLGDRLLPVIDAVVPPLLMVVDGVSNFAEASPKLASGLLGVAAAIAVIKAGAIAFKLAKLTMGNGADRFRLGKTKLSRSTDQTALSANRASKALDRLNRKMGNVGAGAGGGAGGAGGYGGGGGRNRGRSRKGFGQSKLGRSGRRFGRSKLGRLAGLVMGGGAALSMFSGQANAGGLAMAGSDVADVAGGAMGMLPSAGSLGKLGRFGGKVFKPLGVALQGGALVSAAVDGDARGVGAAGGGIAGGLGGAAAGALAGAALGSVVPILGTAVGGIIGGLIGGFGGGELGEWAGGELGGWFGGDKTEQAVPADIASKVNQLQQGGKQIHFAPVINVTPSGDPAYDRNVSDDLMERMKVELSPVLLGNADVATRADASLSDRGDV